MSRKIIKNIKDDIVSFFKNPKEVVKFFLPIILALCLLIPVPYYVKLGGGIIPLDKKIKVEGETKSKGSLNSLYVSEIKGNVLLYLLSYVVPSFEKVKENNVTLDNESDKNYNSREKIYFEQSSDSATKVAFEKAGLKVDKKSEGFVVLYITKDAKTDLLVGDKILEINNKKVSEYSVIENTVKNSSINSKINFLVLRDNKKVSTYGYVIKTKEGPKIGIAISNLVSYKTDRKVSFDFKESASGPSGGLMIALSLYNKLTEEDITRGRVVMGTGTISDTGVVGPVGGIKHKLLGAYKKDADVVLVPDANYKEALKIKKNERYSFKLIKVSSFDDALNKLNF